MGGPPRAPREVPKDRETPGQVLGVVLPSEVELSGGVLLFVVVVDVELDGGGEELGLDGGAESDDDVLGGGFVGVSLRGGVVGFVEGIGVPGGMYVPGGMGAPGASTTGFCFEPGGGRIVTTGEPSGPTVTTAVGDVDGSGCAASLPGTALPGIS
ncbi:hypothetical protein LWP59_07945 [Amycolatopsis acidiphila]|uniref:Uncharacterized protein n=1 Tax=Amycolatopsis acidiphila TaxID=715473 RepID=A0A558AC30_9PSEU|nr:hypothetical protein [Amycolatopsis acidiphila]TVT21826.1 hypothetical protein FNH06_15845 [Amycolatopsis acidiphila]UIJ61546.1 hypothetical protein LWP59_07945 [Amycolatopsis acidiphila]GHG59316.1 hypothetical protein GCM10017788_12630 [Amycolatopsis acidiphila]